MAAFRDVQVAQPARQVRAVVRRGAMLTTLLAWLLLVSFVVVQRALRRGEQARSLRASAADRGSTRLLAAAFLVGALALVAAPALNALGIGAVGPGAVVGWIGIAVMACGLALRLWSQAALGRYYTTTLRHADDQPILASGLMLAWAGAGMATANWAVAAALALVMAVAYGYRIAAEEAMLRGAFGGRYKEYTARTWRLIPYVY
jgi:protein-S-isoprenylcysteine O-methyltransferase